MSYHEWKTLARCKVTEASTVWVKEAQAGANSCDEDADNKKPQVLVEYNSVMLTSSRDDVARFEGSALEAAKNFFEDYKVTD